MITLDAITPWCTGCGAAVAGNSWDLCPECTDKGVSMTYEITHLCAGCGAEIEEDTQGLCARCEEQIAQADHAWKPKQEKDDANV